MLSCDCLIPNAVKSPEIIVENVEDKSGKGILNDEPNYTHKQVYSCSNRQYVQTPSNTL